MLLLTAVCGPEQGEDIYRRLTDTGLRPEITMQIARNVISSADITSNDTQMIEEIGAAEVGHL